jgi:hypothetical protein
MTQLFVLILAALVGLVGFDESAKYEREQEKRPFGISARAAAAGCFIAGLIGAFVVPIVVVAGLAAYAGYREVADYERQYRESPFGISPSVAAAVCFSLGLFGAVVTSPWLWGVVCAFLALIGALGLAIEEKKTLIAEKRALVSEKNALLAEKDKTRQGAATRSAPTERGGRTPEPQKRWLLPLAGSDAQPEPPVPTPSSWPGQLAPSASGNVGDSDLLPRRR